MDILTQQRRSVLLNASLVEQPQTPIPLFDANPPLMASLFDANPPLMASLVEQQKKQQEQILAAALEYQKQQQMAAQALFLQQQPVQLQQQHPFIPSWMPMPMPNYNMMPGTLPGPSNSNKRPSTEPQNRGMVCSAFSKQNKIFYYILFTFSRLLKCPGRVRATELTSLFQYRLKNATHQQMPDRVQ